MNPVLLSTAAMRVVLKDQDNQPIEALEEYASSPAVMREIDGVELNIQSFGELEELSLSGESRQIARQLRHNTLHFVYAGEVNVKEIQSFQQKIIELHELFQFQGVVLHPKRYSMTEVDQIHAFFQQVIGIPKVSFENMIREAEVAQEDFERVFEKPEVGFVLDTTHATLASLSNECFSFEYLQRYIPRTKYIHVSATEKVEPWTDGHGNTWDYHAHRPLTLVSQEERSWFEGYIKSITARDAGVGLVLETLLTDIDPELLVEDLKYMRAYYCCD